MRLPLLVCHPAVEAHCTAEGIPAAEEDIVGMIVAEERRWELGIAEVVDTAFQYPAGPAADSRHQQLRPVEVERRTSCLSIDVSRLQDEEKRRKEMREDEIRMRNRSPCWTGAKQQRAGLFGSLPSSFTTPGSAPLAMSLSV